MTTTEVRAILEQAEKATAGPWFAEQSDNDDGEPSDCWSVETTGKAWDGFTDLGIMLERDAVFVSSARTNVSALCNEVLRRMEVRNTELESQLAEAEEENAQHRKTDPVRAVELATRDLRQQLAETRQQLLAAVNQRDQYKDRADEAQAGAAAYRLEFEELARETRLSPDMTEKTYGHAAHAIAKRVLAQTTAGQPILDRLAKAEAFKTWTHNYLDSKGVPHHPPGPHGAEGCRIGDRMDWVFATLAARIEKMDRARKILTSGSEPGNPKGNWGMLDTKYVPDAAKAILDRIKELEDCEHSTTEDACGECLACRTVLWMDELRKRQGLEATVERRGKLLEELDLRTLPLPLALKIKVESAGQPVKEEAK